MRICPRCRQKYEDAETRFCASDGQPLIEQENLAAQSQPQPAVAEQIAAPFSASLAMAFFAHHFVEQPGWYAGVNGYTSSGSTNVLCQTNVKVNSIKLAYNLLAISFWHLRENNLIRFTAGATEKTFFSTYTPLIIEFNRLNQTKIPGLEFDLMEIIKQSAPGVTVRTVVQRLLGEIAGYPQERVFQRLTQWMIQLGYGQPDVAAKPFFSFTNSAHMNFEFTPDCQRIAGSQPAAQIIHGNWMKFQAEQPEIFRFLNDQVEGAVIRNTRRDRLSTDW